MKKIYLIMLLGFFLISLASATEINDSHELAMSAGAIVDYPMGINVTANNAGWSITKIVKPAGSGATRAYLRLMNNTVMANVSFVDNIATLDYLIELGKSYYILTDNNGQNYTYNISSATAGVNKTNINFIDGAYCPTDCLSGIGTFRNIDSIFTSDIYFDVNLLSPSNTQTILTSSHSFNVSLIVHGENLSYSWKNNTITIWYSNGTVLNQSITTLSGNSTTNNKTINLINFNNYLWSSYACYANDTYSNCLWSRSGNYSFSTSVLVNSINYSSSSYETDYDNILYNITPLSGYTPTNAKLVYNGTEYSMTVTNTGGDNYTLSKLLSLTSSMVGSNTFYIKYNLSSTNQLFSDNYSQTINPIQFGLCNGTNLTVHYLNISFKDESTEDVINATNPTSTFYYWLGDSTLNKTYTYSNTSLNYNYTFCLNPQNKTVYVKPTFQYNNPSYVQRTYEPSTLTLTNATTNVTLYLLSTTDGLYVTFQVSNLAGQTISGVDVSGTRLVGSTVTNVASGITGSDGGVTFWLNYHYSHTFTFTKSGYDTVTYTLTPTQSSYTVTMGSATVVTSSYTRGIKETIYPNFDFLDNRTEYDFNYTIDSEYWSLESFGFSLYYQNGTLIGSASSTTSTGGTVSFNNLNFSTNQTYISMKYYYKINSTFINGTRTFYLQDNYGRSFSIWQFFTDFKSYIDSGNFWGFDEFGKILLSVIVLIMVAGGASLRYGVRSDIFVAGIIFGLVLMLDYGLGWFGTIRIGNNMAVSNLPTIVCAIAIIVLIITEERR